VDVAVAEHAGWRPVDLARAYMDGGARIVQLRAKALSSAALLALCDEVVRAAALYDADVIVNDRVDLARLSGAAGVHVGQEDVAPSAARTQLGSEAIVGYSTHTVVQIEKAVLEPITYLAVGPVFGTSTKDTGYDAVGLELVRAAARRAKGIPVVAIGGITLERAPAVLDAGASAVAVISDLLVGADPRRRAKAYREGLL
jgi:thiamine-phosphate pyrophosphorylase